MPDHSGVRILADDLTGALDSAAPFATPDAPIQVFWRRGGTIPDTAAIDLATREGSTDTAIARHREFRPWLFGGRTAFKKIDSLLRGHWLDEIAALAEDCPRRIVIAPAFPFQGRVTRGGRQWRLDPLEPVGEHLAALLNRRGVAVGSRLVVRDAETDHDLDTVVEQELALGQPILWVGTGGLAAALARRQLSLSPPLPAIERPVLALIGSEHPVSKSQVEAAAAFDGGCHIVLGASASGPGEIVLRITNGHGCIATVAFAGGREEAAAAIDAAFSSVLGHCPRPGALFVSGGETLRGVADALGADCLAVEGALEQGIPRSRLRNGRFHDLPVLSKSGAFGRRDLLKEIISERH